MERRVSQRGVSELLGVFDGGKYLPFIHPSADHEFDLNPTDGELSGYIGSLPVLGTPLYKLVGHFDADSNLQVLDSHSIQVAMPTTGPKQSYSKLYIKNWNPAGFIKNAIDDSSLSDNIKNWRRITYVEIVPD